MSNYVKSGIRNSYSSMMSSKFLDKATGEFKQLKQTPWFLKMKNGRPGYFLKMDDKFQQMPDDCFKATAERTSTYDLSDVEAQIENFFSDNVGYAEVKNEATKD